MSRGMSPKGGHVVLLYKGDDSDTPSINDVLAPARSEMVSVDRIVMDFKPDKQLENLSLRRGGTAHYVTGTEATMNSVLAFAFFEATTGHFQPRNRPVVVSLVLKLLVLL